MRAQQTMNHFLCHFIFLKKNNRKTFFFIWFGIESKTPYLWCKDAKSRDQILSKNQWRNYLEKVSLKQKNV